MDYKCKEGEIVKHMKCDQEIPEQAQEEVEPEGNPEPMDTVTGDTVDILRSNRKSKPLAATDNIENIIQKRKYKKRKTKKEFGSDDLSKSKKSKSKKGVSGKDTYTTRGKIKEMTCEICGTHFRLLPFKKTNKYNEHMRRHGKFKNLKIKIKKYKI